MKDSLRLQYLSIKDSIAGPIINAVLRDRVYMLSSLSRSTLLGNRLAEVITLGMRKPSTKPAIADRAHMDTALERAKRGNTMA